MNDLLQKHGCANVFNVPEGLRELMSDITREVLREQPKKIFDFIANYLSVLLITREHGVLSVKILEDLCDCRPSVCEHLISHGLPREKAESIAGVIKQNIELFEPVEGNETVREAEIVKKVLAKQVLDEDTIATVCQITRNAYREYWYRKKLLEQNVKTKPDQPWEVAAEHTLEIYKKTKPSFAELKRATEKILAAYRGYHVRKNLLRHFKPTKGPIVDQPGPPLDLAASREITLGPLVELNPLKDDVNVLFKEHNIVCHNVDVSQNTLNVTQFKENEAYLQSQQLMEKGSSKRKVSHNIERTSKLSSLGAMYSAVGATALKKPHVSIDFGTKRSSRLPSGLKISFSADPVEVIPYSYDSQQDNEIDEEIKSLADIDDPEGCEIPEDIHSADPAELPAEVPEELPE